MGVACQRASRPPNSVTLVAVTKAVAMEKIQQAIECGVKNFGENYLQEASAKKGQLPASLVWHFIGSIQRRKVKSLVGSFEWIHSVDQFEIAEEINRRAASAGIVQKVLVQVNTSKEETKSGIAPEEVFSFIERLKPLPSIEVKGLMTLPTPHENPEEGRPEFRFLAELLREANRKGSYGKTLTELSMGMSNDFEVAIEEGATMVRIGTALFGPRERRP
jgi:pyridoxal phosphate enzyme (YggS family)